MTDSSPQSKNLPEPNTEAQVRAHLRRHPDFFRRHPEVLEQLSLPHGVKGAVSLMERQASLLRRRNQDLQDQLHQLLESARHNDLQFNKTKRLVLNLLEAQGMDQVVVALDEGLCQDFNADLVRLILFDEGALFDEGTRDLIGNPKVLPLEEAATEVADLVESDWSVCGRLNEDQRRFLFDERAPNVLSAAVIPLVKGRCQGLLAIGSFEDNYFHSSMGTLFLNYVGEILSRVLLRLPAERP